MTNNMRIPNISDEDKRKLYESLGIEFEEPSAIEQPIKRIENMVDEVSLQEQMQSKILHLQDIEASLKEMQNALGAQLQDYKVHVDPKINPQVRDAIRRMFGIDTNVIDYNMFKKALDSRSKAMEAERIKIYGSRNS